MPVQQITVTLRNRVGLHARPAALFVELSNKYESSIHVSNASGQEANGKSILGILSLDIGPGAVISIRAEGDDAKEALDGILSLFGDNFGETE